METTMELEFEPNRIITYPINGGFKRKEPRVQEMKDVWAFLVEVFMERMERGDR